MKAKTSYHIICMSFDGEYHTERPAFDEINIAWDYSSNLGSKWYFYPFHFVVTNETIADAPEPFEWMIGRKVGEIAKHFNIVSKKEENQFMDAEQFSFAL